MIQFLVRVQPGSPRPSVGGERDGALRVRVRARAVDGAATREACEVVADAFGVRASAVRCLKGERSRTKVLGIDGEDVALRARLGVLLRASAP